MEMYFHAILFIVFTFYPHVRKELDLLSFSRRGGCSSHFLRSRETLMNNTRSGLYAPTTSDAIYNAARNLRRHTIADLRESLAARVGNPPRDASTRVNYRVRATDSRTSVTRPRYDISPPSSLKTNSGVNSVGSHRSNRRSAPSALKNFQTKFFALPLFF